MLKMGNMRTGTEIVNPCITKLIFNFLIYVDGVIVNIYVNIYYCELVFSICILFRKLRTSMNLVNPFQPGVAFLYPLKTENLKVFECFQGV